GRFRGMSGKNSRSIRKIGPEIVEYPHEFDNREASFPISKPVPEIRPKQAGQIPVRDLLLLRAAALTHDAGLCEIVANGAVGKGDAGAVRRTADHMAGHGSRDE